MGERHNRRYCEDCKEKGKMRPIKPGYRICKYHFYKYEKEDKELAEKNRQKMTLMAWGGESKPARR